MAGLGIDGLISGFNTTEIVNAILDIQFRGPVDEIEDRIETEVQRIASFQTLSANLLALGIAADTLSSTAPFDGKTSSTSNESVVTASVSNSAAVGNFTIQVDNLAQAEQISTDFFSSPTDELGFTGEFLLNGRSIQVEATDDLDEIARTINFSGAGVTANVVQTSANQFKMVLAAGSTGVAGLDLRDSGSGDLLQALTLTTTDLRNDYTVQANAAGAISNEYADDLQTPLTGPGSFQLTDASGRSTITVNLTGAETLAEIRDTFNTAAAGTNMQAEIIGTGPVRLQIGSTAGIPTEFIDTDGLLAELGVVAGLQSADIANTTTAVGNLFNLSNPTSGTITIDDGEGDTINVTIDLANDSLDDIKAAIDAAVAVAPPGTDIGANILSTGGQSRLEITGATGFSPILTDDNNVLETLGFLQAQAKNEDQAGQNAEFRFNGVTVNRTSNVVADLVDGVTVALLAESAAPITVRVDEERGDITTAVNSFVESYNAAASFIEEQTFFDTSTGDKGILIGDSTARDVQSKMAELMSTSVPQLSGIKLTNLNSGLGVDLGTIKITDKAGNRSEIDLSSAQTVQDVLNLINLDEGINVEARVGGNGKGIVIEDKSGSHLSRLIVEDTFLVQSNETGAFSNEYADINAIPGVAGNFSLTDPTGQHTITVSLNGTEDIGGIANAINTAATGTNLTAEITGAGPVRLRIKTNDDSGIPTEFKDPEGILQQLGFISTTGRTALDLGIRQNTLGDKIFGSEVYSGGKSNLAEFGISLQVTGLITFDSLSFANRLQSDPDSIKNLFTAPGMGIGDRFANVMREMTFPTTGTIDIRVNTSAANIEDYQASINRFNKRAEKMEEVLRRKFNALEATMSASQNLQQLLTQRLGTNNN